MWKYSFRVFLCYECSFPLDILSSTIFFPQSLREVNDFIMDNLCRECNKVTVHKCRRRRQSKRRIPSVRTSIPPELEALITELINDEVKYVQMLKDFLHMEDVYRMDVPFSQRNNLLFESPSFLMPIYKLHQNYLLPLLRTVQICDEVNQFFFG